MKKVIFNFPFSMLYNRHAKQKKRTILTTSRVYAVISCSFGWSLVLENLTVGQCAAFIAANIILFVCTLGPFTLTLHIFQTFNHKQPIVIYSTGTCLLGLIVKYIKLPIFLSYVWQSIFVIITLKLDSHFLFNKKTRVWLKLNMDRKTPNSRL